MVRRGHVLSAPHFVLKKGPGSSVDSDLFAAWSDFDLASALAESLNIPARVANDADVQGAAVVNGKGLEVVITLGTGFGSAVFMDGTLLPHIELAHQPFRKDETYNEQVGEMARQEGGRQALERPGARGHRLSRCAFLLRPPLHRWRQRPPDRAGRTGRCPRAHHRGGQHGGDPGRDQALGRAAPGRMTPPRITLVGGGSTHWTPTLLVDFANTPALAEAEVTLYDIDPTTLPAMLELAAHIARSRDIGLTAGAAPDLPSALQGAEFVLTTLSVGGFASMVHDIEIPATYGLRQPVGDSVGPGGIMRALRSIPVMVDIARAVEEHAPDAMLLNVSNPLSTLCRAMSKETAVTTVGLCNEMVGFQFAMSLIFECGMHEVRPTVAGVDHLPWSPASPSAMTTASANCADPSRSRRLGERRHLDELPPPNGQGLAQDTRTGRSGPSPTWSSTTR